MSQQSARICPGCGISFEPSRSNQVHHNPACKQRAHRLRRARPVSLERAIASQRRADRKHDAHVQRPQQIGGPSTLPLPDLDSYVPPKARSGAARIGDNWWNLSSSPDPEKEVLRRLSQLHGVYAQETWEELCWEAISDLLPAVPSDPELFEQWRPEPWEIRSTEIRRRHWQTKWANHPSLTPKGCQIILTDVPAAISNLHSEVEMNLSEEIRSLRREQKEAFARIESRLDAISAENPSDADFMHEVEDYLTTLNP